MKNETDKPASDPSAAFPGTHPQIALRIEPIADDEERTIPLRPCEPRPPAPTGLLAECERQRGRIVDALRQGQQYFHPCTTKNFAALLKGEKDGFLLPPLGRLFDAAVALDLGDVPAFSGEPQTGRDAVAVLDALITWCRAKQGPSPPAAVKQKLKEPSKDAFVCYRLSLATGQTQKTLADMLSRELGKPVDQSKVSRWLKQVKAWLEAGNILPDLTEGNRPKSKAAPMDPALIDRGTGMGKSIRRRSGGAGRNEELQRLIAEQQAEDDCEFGPLDEEE